METGVLGVQAVLAPLLVDLVCSCNHEIVQILGLGDLAHNIVQVGHRGNRSIDTQLVILVHVQVGKIQYY